MKKLILVTMCLMVMRSPAMSNENPAAVTESISQQPVIVARPVEPPVEITQTKKVKKYKFADCLPCIFKKSSMQVSAAETTKTVQ